MMMKMNTLMLADVMVLLPVDAYHISLVCFSGKHGYTTFKEILHSAGYSRDFALIETYDLLQPPPPQPLVQPSAETDVKGKHDAASQYSCRYIACVRSTSQRSHHLHLHYTFLHDMTNIIFISNSKSMMYNIRDHPVVISIQFELATPSLEPPPNTLPSLPQGFLAGCSKLEVVDLTALSEVRKFPPRFMSGCHNLKTLKLCSYAKVSSLPTNFLSGCHKLKELDLAPLSHVTAPSELLGRLLQPHVPRSHTHLPSDRDPGRVPVGMQWTTGAGSETVVSGKTPSRTISIRMQWFDDVRYFPINACFSASRGFF